MPPKKIAQEVKFLKLFQRRFRSIVDYRAAVDDLFREGLITETAYDEVMEPFSGRVKTVDEIMEDTCAVRRPTKNKNSVKMVKSNDPPPRDREPDPCHGGYYKSSC